MVVTWGKIGTFYSGLYSEALPKRGLFSTLTVGRKN